MTQFDLTTIKADLEKALEALIREARYSRPGDLFILGCSSSEIVGLEIGKGSSQEAGQAVIQTLLPLLARHGFHLAVQGCEHINRSLVVEREIMLRDGLEEVNVLPALHAGGAAAVAAYQLMKDPVMVEFAQGSLGMDIGDTEIGMHIRFVQRPVRLEVTHIGQARLTSLMYRPKLIGGERALHQK